MLLILLQVDIISAQKIVSAINPEAGGFSSARLQRLDNTLNEWVEKELKKILFGDDSNERSKSKCE